jgi:hypothetical protein
MPGPQATASGLFAAPDWGVLGLILCIVGCFLLGNGILFRDTRGLLHERFERTPPTLRTIRDFVFHRVQSTLGFGFLLAGFALQLFGRRHPPAADAAGSLALWVGLVVVVVVGLEFAAWWWSLVALRRELRAWFRQHPPDFENDPHTAREVGELFGIASHGDDTLPSFAKRLRDAVGLVQPARGPGRQPPAEPLEE